MPTNDYFLKAPGSILPKKQSSANIPVQISPYIPKDTIWIMNKGKVNQYFVADSIESVEKMVEKANKQEESQQSVVNANASIGFDETWSQEQVKMMNNLLLKEEMLLFNTPPIDIKLLYGSSNWPTRDYFSVNWPVVNSAINEPIKIAEKITEDKINIKDISSKKRSIRFE